jgi:ABC-type phosphate/phosphonate transport system substrate-binding protein
MRKCKAPLFRYGLVWISLWSVSLTSVFADLTLSAPPRESADDAKRTYEPLAKFFTEILNEQVVYVQPRDWLQYTTEMRNGRYDIVFDGPHFAAWRIKHLNHVPLVKLPGTLDFVVLARWDDKRINKLRDLRALPVCGLPSPNLGTMTVMAQFTNPVTQPDVKEIKGGFDDVLKTFLAGTCRAAIVRDTAFKKLADTEKKQFKVVFKSPPFPNQTVTVSERIRPKMRDKLVSALTVTKGFESAENLFNELSKNAKFFIPAQTAEYHGMETLLEGVVWGW